MLKMFTNTKLSYDVIRVEISEPKRYNAIINNFIKGDYKHTDKSTWIASVI